MKTLAKTKTTKRKARKQAAPLKDYRSKRNFEVTAEPEGAHRRPRRMRRSRT